MGSFIICLNLNIYCPSICIGCVLIVIISSVKVQFCIGREAQLSGPVQWGVSMPNWIDKLAEDMKRFTEGNEVSLFW